MDTMTWLQGWYLSQCDGDWEHTHGIEIGNIDNPGWRVAIGLADTALQSRLFAAAREMRTEQDWIDCRVEGGVFKGFGGPLNLEEILGVFRRWVESEPGQS
jgi:hypothetical protein